MDDICGIVGLQPQYCISHRADLGALLHFPLVLVVTDAESFPTLLHLLAFELCASLDLH